MDNALQVICITVIITCIHFSIVYAGNFGKELGEDWWGEKKDIQFSTEQEKGKSIAEHVKNVGFLRALPNDKKFHCPVMQAIRPKLTGLLNLFRLKRPENTKSTPCEGPGCRDNKIFTTTATSNDTDTAKKTNDELIKTTVDSETTTPQEWAQGQDQNKLKQMQAGEPRGKQLNDRESPMKRE